MTALIIIGVIVLGLVAWFFSAYNGLIKLRNLTQEAWAQIDVELKRRHLSLIHISEPTRPY